LVIAKHEQAMRHLQKQFFYHTIYRRYIALVWGDVAEDEGTITGHIGRHPQHRKMRHVYPDGEVGKSAVTHYRVLRRYGYVTLVECRLETGRTHQIRVHMRYIGHPLFNDELYGGDRIVKGTIFTKYKQFVENCFEIFPRQALHAKSIGFEHPATGEFMTFDSEMPGDFVQLLEKWERYTAGRLVHDPDVPVHLQPLDLSTLLKAQR
jgi:23S rRNA pseudouridine1911/1915/1917 synthase